MRLYAIAVGLASVTCMLPARAAPELPFDTTNQSPLIQIYGLPGLGAPYVLGPSQSRVDLHFEVANHFVGKSTDTESLFLDGETHRTTLKIYRGLTGGREIGIEIPYVDHDGGFMDSFIEGWHDFFGLPQHGRDRMPRDQLLYQYQRNGVDALSFARPTSGIGDVRLVAGLPFPAWADTALRFSLKLPTGDSAKLLGSGATDAALWFSTRCSRCTGSVSWYGGSGILWMGDSDVLRNQQRQIVAFGSAGLHWQALSRLTLGVQLDAHTPFYRDSALASLTDASAQLILGGIWRLSPRYAWELAISEDIAVDTAPDVVVRIGLRSWF